MASRSFAKSRIKGSKWGFFLILALIVLAGLAAAFGTVTPFKDRNGNPVFINGVPGIRYGIDIRGGVEAVFAPQNYEGTPSAQEVEAAAKVLNFRLDQLQILDREVIASPSSGRIIVRFPWRSDEKEFNPDKALTELGQMALLTFRSPDGEVLVDGNMVESAQAAYDEQRKEPIVVLRFNAEGKELFANATEKYINQTIGIYLDEEQLSNPVVQTAITDGEGLISGSFTNEEALDLAAKINGGALPFAMSAISSSTISPSLGQNSLQVMSTAALIAFALICIFMIVRYRLPGFVGCISLTAQVIGILLAISIPQQTLTLQGIAGIILSIGMGVDANIIVAERIREEAATGASLPTVLKNGFAKALSSVLDGNVTVAIAAVVLMIFGSGTVLSFGYSLLAGVILNGITGVWMTRSMIASLGSYPVFQNMAFYTNGRPGWEQKKPLPFYRRRKIFFAVSAAFILIGIVLSLVSGIRLSIQFKGGSLVSYDYSGEINPDEINRNLRDELGLPVQSRIATALSDESTNLVVSVAGNEALTPEQMSAMTSALKELYPDSQFEISQSQLVNPSIGAEMLRNGLLALLIASALIIAYVWFSFRSISGPSAGFMALVALLHDIALAVIAFVLIGSEINETLIAVVLTILGFSINDTIVIYDRIRELIPKYKDEKTLPEIVEMAITGSMGRTIYTSLCIFVAILVALIFAWMNGLTSIIEFAVPILVGASCGSYSSIFISSPLWAVWKTRGGRSGFEE